MFVRVDAVGFEPTASALRKRRSSADLRARGRDRRCQGGPLITLFPGDLAPGVRPGQAGAILGGGEVPGGTGANGPAAPREGEVGGAGR